MREILVSGSTAHDTIMHYDGDFKTQFPNGDTESGLHMSVVCNHSEKFLWGTWLNIAYNLALLGENPILLSSVGVDFGWDELIDEKVNLKYLHRDRRRTTAWSMILSDGSNHRITAFYPGAMLEADQTHVSYVTESVWIAIVSANQVSAMLNHARELQKAKIKFFVDPAQQITEMSREELQELLALWDYLIVNQYEMKELQIKTWHNEAFLKANFEKIIVTHGAQGSELIEENHITHIPSVDFGEVIDTTGAGDAYRAWILKALIDWHDWKTACRLWTILATYCIQGEWGQNHHASLGNLSEDMMQYFSEEIDLHAKRKY